jgi:hypothetical protein
VLVAASSFIWVTALVALFPGNILSAILIEKVLEQQVVAGDYGCGRDPGAALDQ